MVKDLIAKGAVGDIKEIMEKSTEHGMQTFDQALLALAQAGKISQEEAIRNADSANNLRLKFKLAQENPDVSNVSSGGFTLEGAEDGGL